MKDLRHPNIIWFKDHFVKDNCLCLIFEYCDKGDLDIFLKNQRKNKVTDSRIKKIFVETLLGIEYLHSHNIIHRDIKPSNIFLKSKEYTVNIGDFGIAA
jgi:NIMA (never in mitosis gene a)-related kinase